MVVAKKRCSTCHRDRPRCEFRPDDRYRQGLISRCKSCVNSGNRETYQRHRESRLERMRQWRVDNREWFSNYAKENSNAYNDYWQRRRARLEDLPFDGYRREDIFERDEWICQICFEPVEKGSGLTRSEVASIDHVIPISHPDCPGDIESNVQLAHFRCNAGKNDKLS